MRYKARLELLWLCFFFLLLFMEPLSAKGSLFSDTPVQVCTRKEEACQLINQWYIEGTAAGNIEDYYDNRDRGHSSINLSHYPQLKAVSYTPQELQKRADWAGQQKLLPFVTIGNSSTASSVYSSGSNVRAMYYSWGRGLQFLYHQYRSNNLYIYPEHRDHDIGSNGHPGHGDIFPTNSPYVIISQGSSGSDGPFIHACVQTLAALHPSVKDRLKKTGTLMATLQMILRACNKTISYPGDYLTGKAHPTAFVGKDLDSVKMVQMAHAITPENIPPMVQLQILDETFDQVDTSYFTVDRSEKLGSTPCVIARVMRGPEYTKHLVIGAKNSFDINFKPLTFHWVLLRGDPELVTITPKYGGSVAEIAVSYHHRRPVASDSLLESSRVDIGIFAHNGEYYSAPGLITVHTLDNERRTYDEQQRLVEIDFNASRYGFEIHDWLACLQFFSSKDDDLAHRLVRNFFSSEEKTVLRRLKENLAPALEQVKEQKKNFDIALGKFQKAKKSYHSNKSSLESTQKLKKLRSTYESGQSLVTAEAKLAQSLQEQGKTQKRLKEAKKELQQTEAVISQTIEKKHPDIGNESIQNRVYTLLTEKTKDPSTYIEQAEEIDQWVNAHGSKKMKVEFERRLNFLLENSIFRKGDDGHIQLAKQTLTSWERYQVERLHLLLLIQVFYSEFVSEWESYNLVDPRLSKLKPIRYVYSFDASGKLLDRSEHR